MRDWMQIKTTETSSAPGRIRRRAVQYLRMSTDNQSYSLLNQASAIARYAEARAIDIVETFEDAGRSGLTFTTRPGLMRLIARVQSGTLGAHCVLVYDVSRWGRFQDVDESAHLEFICRSAGVEVVYCAELFAEADVQTAAVIKALKRIMAAEYSRELSRKVWLGQSRIVERGFAAGSVAPFGFRRVLYSHDGRRRGELAFGERKSLQSDRVILELGPEDEQAVVRGIFSAYIGGVSARTIAHDLNRDGVVRARGAWTREVVDLLLQNRKYCGEYLWSRTSQGLLRPRGPTPPSAWVRSLAPRERIVTPEVFEAAQAERRRRSPRQSRDALIAHVRMLAATHGYISNALLDAADGPCAATVRRRLGDLVEVHAQWGGEAAPSPPAPDMRLAGKLRLSAWRASFASWFISRGHRVRLDRSRLVFDEAFVLSMTVAGTRPGRGGKVRSVRFDRRIAQGAQWALVCAADRATGCIQTYLLLPQSMAARGRYTPGRGCDDGSHSHLDLGAVSAALIEAVQR